VEVRAKVENLIMGFGRDIRFDRGLVYATSGAVVDPVALTPVGSYSASGPVCPDSRGRYTYFMTGGSLRIFDRNTFLPVTSLAIPGVAGNPGSLLMTGQGPGYDQLAFRTDGGQVFLVRVSWPPLVLTKSVLPAIQTPYHGPVTYTLVILAVLHIAVAYAFTSRPW
jgi:hypothetical protein